MTGMKLNCDKQLVVGSLGTLMPLQWQGANLIVAEREAHANVHRGPCIELHDGNELFKPFATGCVRFYTCIRLQSAPACALGIYKVGQGSAAGSGLG